VSRTEGNIHTTKVCLIDCPAKGEKGRNQTWKGRIPSSNGKKGIKWNGDLVKCCGGDDIVSKMKALLSGQKEVTSWKWVKEKTAGQAGRIAKKEKKGSKKEKRSQKKKKRKMIVAGGKDSRRKGKGN